jgi:hypothetical protein
VDGHSACGMFLSAVVQQEVEFTVFVILFINCIGYLDGTTE